MRATKVFIGTLLCSSAAITHAADGQPAVAAATQNAETTTSTQDPPQSAENDQQVADIVVTARRREESLISVPIAISAVTSETIERANIKDITDVQNYTPGLSLTEASAGRQDRNSRNYVIRGLVTQSGNAIAPSTTLFLDGAPVISGNVAGLTDMQRVEVLKGPQAVYFGRGTYAGAINLVTKVPRLNEWGGSGSLEVNEYDYLDLAASVDGPLVTDRVGIRLAGRYQTGGGTYKNNSVQPGASDELGDRETKSVSGTLYARPTDDLTIRIYGALASFDDGSPASTRFQTGQMTCALGALGARNNYICGVPPRFPKALLGFDDAVDPAVRAGLGPLSIFGRIFAKHGGTASRVQSLNASIAYSLKNGWEIESLTAMNREKVQTITDEDSRASTSIPNPSATAANGFRPFFNYLFAIDRRNRDFSQDLRITSDQEKPIRWMVGGNYVKLSAELGQAADTPLSPEFRFFSNTGKQSARTYSGYAATYFDLPADLTLSLEGRYQWDRISNQARGAGGVPIPNRPILAKTYRSFSPRISLDYRPSPDFTIFGLWSRGYRPGGFNTNLLTQPQNIIDQIVTQTGGAGISYRQEKLDNYELGVKGRLLDRKVSASLSVYYQDLSDIQSLFSATVFTNTVPPQPIILGVTSNQAGAKLYGVEAEVVARVTPALTLEGYFANNNSEVKRGFCSVCRSLTGGTGIVEDAQFNRAPRYTATFAASYRMPLSDSVEAYFRGDYRYESKKYADLLNILNTGDRQIVNARAGVEFAQFSLEGYVTNLFGDDTYLDVSPGLDVFTFTNSAVSVALPFPRTFGARVRYSF